MNKNQSVGMYVILGIMVLAFVSMLFSGPTSSTEELSYTNFIQKVENKEIKSVDLGKTFFTDRYLHCCFNIYKRPEASIKVWREKYGE